MSTIFPACRENAYGNHPQDNPLRGGRKLPRCERGYSRMTALTILDEIVADGR